MLMNCKKYPRKTLHNESTCEKLSMPKEQKEPYFKKLNHLTFMCLWSKVTKFSLMEHVLSMDTFG